MTEPDEEIPHSSREIYGPHAMRLSWPTRLVFGVLVVIGLVSLGFGVSSRWSDRASERSDRLRGCTSNLATELVSGPQAIALKALAQHGTDSPQFLAATDELQPERYQELTRLALSDPDAFLDECARVLNNPNAPQKPIKSTTTDGTTATTQRTTTTSAAPFASCDDARKAGAAPLHRGDPGYSTALDRDGDGIACE